MISGLKEMQTLAKLLCTNYIYYFRYQDIINCIPQCSNNDDNIILTTIPDGEKIKGAVFSISAASLAGPNDYNGTFINTCWDIIKNDIRDFVQDFYDGKRLSTFLIFVWPLYHKCTLLAVSHI